MMVREPIVADRFYPGQADVCDRALTACLTRATPPPKLPNRLLGGIVPHAGWTCSGHVAGAVLQALSTVQPDNIVLFGAAHRWAGREAALFAAGKWETPLGAIPVDERLAERVLAHTNTIAADPFAHESEHSLEVQMPFIGRLFPQARVLPVMVPPTKDAPRVGESIARTLATYRADSLIIGTTDLTHYGMGYGFTSHGPGEAGRTWARDINDRRLIDLVLAMNAPAIVPEAQTHRNACGGGAVAATIAACVYLGATDAVLLEHTTSHAVLGDQGGDDSVGYAGIVFGAN